MNVNSKIIFMKSTLILILSISFGINVILSNPLEEDFNFTTWNNLLNSHVSKDGKVNYKGFQQEREKLGDFLKSLSHQMPEENWSDHEKLAYWINAYNAFTISLIIDHYPLKSIMDIKNAWDLKFIQLGDQVYSLNEIEHEIIRKEFNEPRIHFALVCAAISCPILLNEAYKAENLEQQLQQQGVRFINNPSKNFITPKKAKVSQLFNWFGEDFTKNGSLIKYLNSFSETQLTSKAKIEFMEYNWDLNE